MDTPSDALTPDLGLAESTAELRDRLTEILGLVHLPVTLCVAQTGMLVDICSLIFEPCLV